MFTWENERFKIENKSLIKVIGSEKVGVANFSQKTRRDEEGLLVVNTREVDELVAVLTCAIVLQYIDSFTKG
jgi:hypothetical protein